MSDKDKILQDIDSKLAESAAKRFCKPEEENMKSIQDRITEMAFEMNKVHEEMRQLQLKYWKKLEINLRWAFRERFHFPMKLARGEFIRYQNREYGITIFSYDGHAFAVEREEFGIDDSSIHPRAFTRYRFETIKEDDTIPNILKARITPDYGPKTFDAMQYLLRNPSVHLH